MSTIPNYSLFDFRVTTSIRPPPWIHRAMAKASLASNGVSVGITTATSNPLAGSEGALRGVNTVKTVLNHIGQLILRQSEAAAKAQANTDPHRAVALL